MILLALAPTRDNSSINTECTTIIFIRLLPPTNLLPRGETLFHLPLINILEIFKDFSSTTRIYSKTFHHQPGKIQRLFINNPKFFKNFFACRIVLSADHQYPRNIQGLSGQQAATSSSNQQTVYRQQAATTSSNQQAVSQQQAATSSSNQQAVYHQQQPASSIPAATSNHPATSSNQQQQSTEAISYSNQQQSTAAVNSSKKQRQPAFILLAAPTRSTPAPVSYH